MEPHKFSLALQAQIVPLLHSR